MVSLPYIASPGSIPKALSGIKAASVPDRVSQDFVKTILKIPGGSGDQMTTFLKKIGFADSGGKPTELYKSFRNPNLSGQSVAKAIRHAYAPLYIRNEFMHELSDDELKGLLIEETGLSSDSNPVKLTLNCIKLLKDSADFNDTSSNFETPLLSASQSESQFVGRTEQPQTREESSGSLRFNLGYTINLNLPASTDPEVFNAIFKSLKDHLLSDKDA